MSRTGPDAGSDTLVIDSVDEGIAQLEDHRGGAFRLSAALLPRDAREGDVLRFDVIRDGERSLIVLRRDAGARAGRLERARERLDRLRRKDPGGDIVL